MRTYQARFEIPDEVPLHEYASVFNRALRSMHASRLAGCVLPKPRFSREFGLTSRQYNAVKFSLDGMESSIVELRPGRIADLQQHIKTINKKLAKLLKPKILKEKSKTKKITGKRRAARSFEETHAKTIRSAAVRDFRIHNVTRRRKDLARQLVSLQSEGMPHICFRSRKLFNASTKNLATVKM
jgi:hypothetical protein